MSMIMRAVRVGVRSTAFARPAVARFSGAAAGGDDVIVADMADSIERCVPSPPPLHCFEEPPIMIEVAGSEQHREH